MESENKLTEKRELFCQYYGQLSDTYNNGTHSYAMAYGYDLETANRDDFDEDENGKKILRSSTYDKMANTCSVEAHRLLRIPKIIDRINEIKAAHVESDLIVDAKMMDIIQNGKYTDALAAIKHRNELKQRVTKKVKVELDDPRKDILKQYLGDTDAGQTEKAQSRPSKDTA
jgi:phage terminase small subunit